MAFNIIQICRGDSYKFVAEIEDNSSEDGYYHLQDHDVVYFGVMYPNGTFEDAILKKRYTKADELEDGGVLVTITPDDTVDLKPGVYHYSVKLAINRGSENEEVQTVIKRTKFVIYE